MSDDKKRWMGAKVTEQVFDAVNSLASMKGVHPGKYLPEIIEAGLKTIAERESEASNDGALPLQVRLWLAVTSMQEREVMIQHLTNLAYYALRDNDESNLDLIEGMAGEMGIPMAEIIENVNTSVTPTIKFTSDPTSVESCMQWLEKTLAFQGELPATYCKDHARGLGFSDYTLNQAKARLPITSERRSKKWVWIWTPTPNQIQTNKQKYLAQVSEAISKKT